LRASRTARPSNAEVSRCERAATTACARSAGRCGKLRAHSAWRVPHLKQASLCLRTKVARSTCRSTRRDTYDALTDPNSSRVRFPPAPPQGFQSIGNHLMLKRRQIWRRLCASRRRAMNRPNATEVDRWEKVLKVELENPTLLAMLLGVCERTTFVNDAVDIDARLVNREKDVRRMPLEILDRLDRRVDDVRRPAVPTLNLEPVVAAGGALAQSTVGSRWFSPSAGRQRPVWPVESRPRAAGARHNQRQ